MYKVVICDDETDIRRALDIYLKSDGYETLLCGSGEEMLSLLPQQPDLVLLDVMMPGMDGITALSELRKVSNIPVILLTAKSEDADKILGLNVGADDYITKPFVAMEVLARVRSQLRRYRVLGGASGAAEQSVLRCGPIAMDDSGKTVAADGEPVLLTPKEYDILRLLMQSPGRTFPPEEIYRQVWKESPLGAEGTVAVHIRHLREKIEIDPANPRHLLVVWGQGYKLISG